jgi:phosphoribosyl 1,2-cyclic phosphodiesterase
VRFSSLGSGSSGNALVVEAGASRVLLDCGFSLKETEARLFRIRVEPSSVSAVLVTHEHEDHASGAFTFARRHRIPVYLSHGTLAALRQANARVDDGVAVRLVHGDSTFDVGELQVLPYTVPHDAREPLQYVFGDGARRLGVLTDVGCSTPHIESMLRGCHALVLETNHDLDMLMGGSYPPRLKSRIAGRMGHLNNGASGDLLRAVAGAQLQHVVAAHLSHMNNTPELARAALAVALGCAAEWISVATQAEGFAWRSLD